MEPAAAIVCLHSGVRSACQASRTEDCSRAAGERQNVSIDLALCARAPGPPQQQSPLLPLERLNINNATRRAFISSHWLIPESLIHSRTLAHSHGERAPPTPIHFRYIAHMAPSSSLHHRCATLNAASLVCYLSGVRPPVRSVALTIDGRKCAELAATTA